ncbi:MAG TPA: hypothetical protein VLT33_00205, partial [Labilithrix sp.]|nr:hypothetical protein [Labilithrix sp.]
GLGEAMKFTYHLRKEPSGWLADCVESDAMGEGRTECEAVESLRVSLEERMFRPDAVAPPPVALPRPTIVLELAAAAGPDSLDLVGPGG